MSLNPPIRILMAKPGLDGHDRGIKVLAAAYRDAGMDVIYLGLRQTPDSIVRVAIQEGADVIAIDEAQFFDEEIVTVCNKLANQGCRVIIAGLDMDYKGNPFGPMPNLMAIAEYVTKVHAICSETGNIANYSYRKKKEDSIILIGEEDEYKALSRELFFKKMNSKKKKT